MKFGNTLSILRILLVGFPEPINRPYIPTGARVNTDPNFIPGGLVTLGNDTRQYNICPHTARIYPKTTVNC